MNTLQTMKRSNPIAFWLPIIILSCLLAAAVWYISPVFITSPRERAQQDLAKQFGVKIEDHPYPSSFPSGYFASILEPGMSISEVHDIVRGYEKVVHCGNVSEIYYYFSTDLKDAKRFEIVYDEAVYSRFEAEEDDSRTLPTYGCLPGPITE